MFSLLSNLQELILYGNWKQNNVHELLTFKNDVAHPLYAFVISGRHISHLKLFQEKEAPQI